MGTVDEFVFAFHQSEKECENLDPCTSYVFVKQISTCFYTMKPCSECGAMVLITTNTDANPTELSWQVTKNEQKSMGGGIYDTSYSQYTDSICLPFGVYEFTAFDSYGDGFSACFKNDATCGYSIAVNNSTIISRDGSFSFEQKHTFGVCFTDEQCDDGNPCTNDTCDEAHNFCKFDLICSNCNKKYVTIVTNTDLRPYFFSWKLTSKKTNAEILSQGPYPNQKSYTRYEASDCLSEGQYTFTVFDSEQDGLNDCDDNNICGYYVSIDNVIIIESNDDNFEEKHHSFKIVQPTNPPSFQTAKPTKVEKKNSDKLKNKKNGKSKKEKNGKSKKKKSIKSKKKNNVKLKKKRNIKPKKEKNLKPKIPMLHV